jgi:ribose/xylose/arabinose/galactoside ABC-type transport system permease subunit
VSAIDQTRDKTETWAGVAELLRANGIVLVFALFVLFAAAISNGRFLQPSNISIILFQSSIVGVLALAEMLVMLAGGIDLSIAALAVLAAIIMGGAGSERQQAMSLSAALPYVGFLPAILIAGVSALLIGFVNGLIIVKLRIPAFIATLAMALLLSGLGLLLTGGSPIYYPDPFFKNFGESKLLLLPYPVYVLFLLTIFMMFVLSRTKIGVIVYALGSNYRAARLSGLPVTWTALCVYTISGAFAAVAGFLFLARTAFVAPNSGENLLLTAIASVVVGGVSLAGGKGSIRNAFFGVLLLASLSNLMNILLISPHIQDAVSGVIILIAIAVNKRIDPERD